MISNIKQYLVVWLIAKIQKYGPRKVDVLGKTYEISKEVFNPKYYYTSKFMAEHIRIMPGDVVLDMGTGSGIQAITAAEKASEVIAIDINPEAVEFAGKNVQINGLKSIVSVIPGDLFMPLGPHHKFNVILFTPPYLEGKPETDFEHALFDSDKNLIRRFFREAGEFLKPDGYVQMLYSSMSGYEQAMQIAEEYGWRNRLVAREETFTEVFFIYKFTLA